MTIEGRKIAITGAGRSLGAALAIVSADRGAHPVLLGRSRDALELVADAIEVRTGRRSPVVVCDLADAASVAAAAGILTDDHANLDCLVNSGAHWSGGKFEAMSDADIAAVVGSALTGTMALTRRLLPLLRARPTADIHTVVSKSGLQYARLRGSSVAFRAAKAGQDGFVQGLTEELAGSSIRVTSVYPGIIEDISPLDPAWNVARSPAAMLSNREVVEAILFALEMPANVSVRSLVIECTNSDFLV
jgi:NADP-dependent 3-hydroxy acid dehydrogenase YdfG